MELATDVIDEWDVRYGIAFTEPNYSRHGWQQTVVPLLDEGFEVGVRDVTVSGDWLAPLGSTYRTTIAATPMLWTIFEPRFIARWLDVVAPARVVAQIERELARHFGL